MTQKELIGKIKAEIERRKKENQKVESEGGAGAYWEDVALLSFIESLEKEQDKCEHCGEFDGTDCAYWQNMVRPEGCIHYKEKSEIPTIKGWVARDKNCRLHVFEVEPRRTEKNWWDRDYQCTEIDKRYYPDLHWEDDPIEVELTIHRV